MATTVMFDAFKHDGRAGCGILFWAGAIHRKYVTAGIALGIFQGLSIIPSFYFGAFPDLNARNVVLSLSDDVEIVLSNVLFNVDKLMTFELFLGKNLITALTRPGWYVNLVSRLASEKTTAGELRGKLKNRVLSSVSNFTGIASLNQRGERPGTGFTPGSTPLRKFLAHWMASELRRCEAAHVTHRIHITAGIAIGIIAFLVCISGFYSGAAPDLNARNINLGLSGDVEFSFVVDKHATVVLILCKNLFTAVRHPVCYNNLKSRLIGEKITAGELRRRLGDRTASVSDLERVASLNHRGNDCERGRGRGRTYNL